MDHLQLLLLLLLRFCSAEFVPTDNYLLNCGSAGGASFSNGSDSRLFLPDSTSTTGVTFSFDGSSSVADPNPAASTPEPYRTVRLFSAASSYAFRIGKQGTHVVRLHFYPFAIDDLNLSSSVFNVSASGALLLTSFTPSPTSDPLVLKEFYLPISAGTFSISFSSPAFVSAIEVFSAPDELLVNNPTRIVPGAATEPYVGLSTQMLETVHRINVGGEKLTPRNDTLWRTWVTDDAFLRTKPSALEKTGRPKYLSGEGLGSSEEIAPEKVYGTLRELNGGGAVNASGGRFNLTWGLSVSSEQSYLVRMHFCDIVSDAAGDLVFDSYINGLSAFKDTDIAKRMKQELGVPYYTDSVVDAGDAAELVVSVGPSSGVSSSKRNAILNGLEVMKINGEPVPTESAEKGRNLGAVVGAVVGCLVFVGLATVLGFIVTGRWKRKPPPSTTVAAAEEGGSEWTRLYRPYRSQTTGGSGGSALGNLNLELKLPFADILLATKNFAGDRQVGQGGFGKVYKGVLQDGRAIAVKRGSRGSGQGLSEFYTEIMVLSKIRHRHLVSLIGYCEEQSEMILVYEFMENGTLRDHLCGPDRAARRPLSWIRRLEICIASASGLHYLHTGSAAQGIIHRDVKSANILLDGNYVAKVADFGLSKLGPLVDKTHVSTNVKGSFGYLDPEYFKTQQLTDKSDVYSFGVVLLEVLCARPAIDSSLPWEQQNLADWGLKTIGGGKLRQIVDASIAGTINANSLRKYGDTVEKCLSQYGVDRPSMADAMWNLDYALKLQQTGTTHQPFDESATIVSASLSSTASPPAESDHSMAATDLGLQVPVPDVSDDSQSCSVPVFSQLVTTKGR